MQDRLPGPAFLTESSGTKYSGTGILFESVAFLEVTVIASPPNRIRDVRNVCVPRRSQRLWQSSHSSVLCHDVPLLIKDQAGHGVPVSQQ